MMIPGLVPYKGTMMISGAPGASKTWYALECGLALTCYTKAFGKFKGENRRVMYVGEDSPMEEIGAMCRKLLRGHGIDAAASGGNFPMVINQGCNLNDTAGMLDLIGLIESEMATHEEDEGDIEVFPPSGLVILDSLRTMHDKQENNSDDMKLVMGRIKKLAELVCVMILHHEGKPTEVARAGWSKPRGSGEIIAACNGIVNLEKKGYKVKATVERRRAAPLIDFEYVFQDEDDTVRLVAQEAGANVELTKFVGATGYIERQDIYRALVEGGYKGDEDAIRRQASRIMQRYVAEGVMSKQGPGRWKLLNGKGLGA